MDRSQKAAVIDEVAGQITESEALFAVDYRGISVPAAAELRTRLRDADASFRIVKNTLTELAADQAETPQLKVLLEGPTAIAFVRGDAALAAKALTEFQRSTGTLAFKGGLLGGDALTVEQITDISRLPSREVLIGRLVGLVASPLTGLAGAMGGLIGGLARQLQQIADQGLVSGEAPAAATPAPAAESPEPSETQEPAPSDDETAEERAAIEADPDSEGTASSEEPGPDPDPDPSQP